MIFKSSVFFLAKIYATRINFNKLVFVDYNVTSC